MSNVDDQLDRLVDVDWDVLVVLDALRWDYWRDLVGGGECVWSPGSSTPEWIRAAHRHLDFSDVACITANPEVTRWTFSGLYADRDDLWLRGWEYVNGIGTVPPGAVVDAVDAELIVGPDRRVYAHFAQPHGPYPVHSPPVPVMRNNPEANEIESRSEYEYMPDEIIMDPTALLEDDDSWLDEDLLASAYESNLEWVWDAIQLLLDRDRTVVVTADHGELLGEKQPAPDLAMYDGDVIRYGHPPGSSHEKLREVPFYVV